MNTQPIVVLVMALAILFTPALITSAAVSSYEELSMVVATTTVAEPAEPAAPAVAPVFSAAGDAPEEFALTLPEGRYYATAQTDVGAFISISLEDKALSIFSFGGGTRSDAIAYGKPYTCEKQPLSVRCDSPWTLDIYAVDDLASTPMAALPEGAVACYEGSGNAVLLGINLDEGPHTVLIENETAGLWLYGPQGVNIPIAEPGSWEMRLSSATDDAISDGILFVETYGDPNPWRITIYPEGDDPAYIFRPQT